MYNWKPPLYDGTDPVKFVGKKIIPSIVAAFKANSYDFEKDGVSFSFLIAFAGNIFEIGDSLDISQSIDGLYGIGSGSPYALGFLAGTLANLGKEDWAQSEFIEALQISAKYDINTCAPFQIEIQKAQRVAQFKDVQYVQSYSLNGKVKMKLFLIAVGTVSAFLFIMWMIIEKDNFLDNETMDPWGKK